MEPRERPSRWRLPRKKGIMDTRPPEKGATQRRIVHLVKLGVAYAAGEHSYPYLVRAGIGQCQLVYHEMAVRFGLDRGQCCYIHPSPLVGVIAELTS